MVQPEKQQPWCKEHETEFKRLSDEMREIKEALLGCKEWGRPGFIEDSRTRYAAMESNISQLANTVNGLVATKGKVVLVASVLVAIATGIVAATKWALGIWHAAGGATGR
jgi:hypothetical protein